MKLKAWKCIGRYSFDADSSGKTIARDSYQEVFLPGGPTRYVPAIRMIVTNQRGIEDIIYGRIQRKESYEVYLEDLEHNFKTSYGNNYSSLEQAKFVADLRLIDLGYSIIEPYLLQSHSGS